MRMTLIVANILLIFAISDVASAASELTISPLSQDVLVGSTATYILKLNTTDTGDGKLNWQVEGSHIVAAINSKPFAKKGTLDITNTPGIPQTFTLYVRPMKGVTIGEPVDIEVNYKGPNNKGTKLKIKAKVTGSVVPVPELSTAALTSAGLIGLFGLGRLRKQE